MFSKNIIFENFKKKKINKKLKIFYKSIVENRTKKKNLINSFTKSYSYSFDKKKIIKFKKFKIFQIFGMGGSSLGAKAIYDFVNHKIKKKFYFYDNLDLKNQLLKKNQKIFSIVISKSGNTLETIVNDNIFSSKNKLYITESRGSYLRNFASRLKSEIIEHKNFIGGRYSVLSEVGMLPAELMGLNSNKFKRFDQLILNKSFVNNLLTNVNIIYDMVKKKRPILLFLITMKVPLVYLCGISS